MVKSKNEAQHLILQQFWDAIDFLMHNSGLRLNALNPDAMYFPEFKKKLEVLQFKNGILQDGSGEEVSGDNGLLPYVLVGGLICLVICGMLWWKLRRVKLSKAPTTVKPEELVDSLTRREKEILKYLVNGDQNKEIADKLNLSVSTIKTHVSNILKKLDVKNRNDVRHYESYLS